MDSGQRAADSEVGGSAGETVAEGATVRIARRDDVAAIVRLIDGGTADGSSRETPDALRRYLEVFEELQLDPNSELLVLDVEGDVVGTASLTYSLGLARQGMRRCTVESVHVAADWRSQGLGAVLIQAAIDLAHARGCGVVQLTSDKRRTDAHRFYRQLGFATSHEGFKLYLTKPL